VVDEEAVALVDHQILHQCRARPIVMAPITWLRADFGLRMRPAAQTASMRRMRDLAGRGIDRRPRRNARRRSTADSACRGAVLDLVLGRQLARCRPLRPAEPLRLPARTWPSANTASAELKPSFLRHGLAQLHAGGVDAGGRSVGAPLPARPGRHGEVGIAQPNDDLVERHAHHLGRGLRDDRVAAGADVGHVGLDGDDALGGVQPHARPDFITGCCG
jgi:hypothetical protein